MSTPISEQIATVLVGRLEGITQQEGFDFDVSEVVRIDRHGKQPKYRHLGIIIDETKERNPNVDTPGNPPGVGYDLTFRLHLICRDGGDPDARAISDSDMQNAVRKAVTLELGDWGTFSGYAMYADFATPEPHEEADGEVSGSVLPLIVTYRVSEYSDAVQR